jgi:predicted RecB family endonuclease
LFFGLLPSFPESVPRVPHPIARADGYEVALEERLTEGHYVGIVARRDGEAIAVEVETGKSDVIANVRGGLDGVTVAATSQTAYHQARRTAHDAGLLGPNLTIARAAQLVRDGVPALHGRHEKLRTY